MSFRAHDIVRALADGWRVSQTEGGCRRCNAPAVEAGKLYIVLGSVERAGVEWVYLAGELDHGRWPASQFQIAPDARREEAKYADGWGGAEYAQLRYPRLGLMTVKPPRITPPFRFKPKPAPELTGEDLERKLDVDALWPPYKAELNAASATSAAASISPQAPADPADRTAWDSPSAAEAPAHADPGFPLQSAHSADAGPQIPASPSPTRRN